MGMRKKCLQYFREVLSLRGFDESKKYSCCILGATQLRRDARRLLANDHPDIEFWMLRDYLLHLGWDVIEIDKNDARSDFQLDLCKSVPSELKNRFDIIIDIGTSEHITNQYILFRNKHNMIKIKGIIISVLPFAGSYSGHSSWQYSWEFLNDLFSKNSYCILDTRVMANRYSHTNKVKGKNRLLVYFAYMKMNKHGFIDKKSFTNPIFDRHGHNRDLSKYYQVPKEKLIKDYGKHYSVLQDLVRQRDIRKMVEVGVWKSQTSQRVLAAVGDILDEYWAVDKWEVMGPEHGRMSRRPQENWDLMYERACYLMTWFPALRALRMSSLQASALFKDGTFDFVYIDASNFYEDVLSDIKAWLPKVKRGGLIGGHDYTTHRPDHQGVKKAVDEMFGGDVYAYSDESSVWICEV